MPDNINPFLVAQMGAGDRKQAGTLYRAAFAAPDIAAAGTICRCQCQRIVFPVAVRRGDAIRMVFSMNHVLLA